TPLVQDVLLERCSLGAKRTAIDGVIRIAFDMNDLRRDVFCAVADGVNDNAATHRAVGTRRAGFVGASDLQRAQLRVSRLQIEAKQCSRGSANGREFQEIPAG